MIPWQIQIGSEFFTLFLCPASVSSGEVVFIDKDLLYPGSRDDINLVIINKTKDVWAAVGRDSKPSRDSLAWHKEFIMSTGRLCAPVSANASVCAY